MRKKFYVLSSPGGWLVQKPDSGRVGPFPTQQDAIDWARTAAKLSAPSQVLIQGRDGRFRTEWTYGNDPYPPLG